MDQKNRVFLAEVFAWKKEKITKVSPLWKALFVCLFFFIFISFLRQELALTLNTH